MNRNVLFWKIPEIRNDIICMASKNISKTALMEIIEYRYGIRTTNRTILSKANEFGLVFNGSMSKEAVLHNRAFVEEEKKLPKIDFIKVYDVQVKALNKQYAIHLEPKVLQKEVSTTKNTTPPSHSIKRLDKTFQDRLAQLPNKEIRDSVLKIDLDRKAIIDDINSIAPLAVAEAIDKMFGSRKSEKDPNKQCRWLYGDPVEFDFCGRTITDGSKYCLYHYMQSIERLRIRMNKNTQGL